MIRSDTFKISEKPYAIDLSKVHVNSRAYEFQGRRGVSHNISLRAVWYRRKNGVTYAVIGSLWDIASEHPGDDAERVLREVFTDGRYGGSPHGRWDGRSYYAHHGTEAERIEHMKILGPMLADFPVGRGAQPPVPKGYDGWWRY